MINRQVTKQQRSTTYFKSVEDYVEFDRVLPAYEVVYFTCICEWAQNDNGYDE